MFNRYNRAQVSFDLRNEIGQNGQNSQTFIAHDFQLDAEIVVKRIDKREINTNSLDEYFNESRTLYLSSHPNVVRILYACEDENYVYIAMPFYKKGSLKDLMDQRFLSAREIITFGIQILSALHNIHSKGLIHFDIKPDNVLLSDRAEALLSDFGLAKKVNMDGQASQARTYIRMIPPEATAIQSFSHAFDIYQFGLTLYRMCNGNRVFDEQFARYRINSNDKFSLDRDRFRNDIQGGLFPDRNVFLEHIPQKLSSVIRKCIQPDISRRYGSALEVANALAGINGNLLDWQYSQDQTQRIWRKSNDQGKTFSLSVNSTGSSSASKKTSSGNTQPIRSFCKIDISKEEIISFLEGH